MGDSRCRGHRTLRHERGPSDQHQADKTSNQDKVAGREIHLFNTYMQLGSPMVASTHDGGTHCAGHGALVANIHQKIL